MDICEQMLHCQRITNFPQRSGITSLRYPGTMRERWPFLCGVEKATSPRTSAVYSSYYIYVRYYRWSGTRFALVQQQISGM